MKAYQVVSEHRMMNMRQVTLPLPFFYFLSLRMRARRICRATLHSFCSLHFLKLQPLWPRPLSSSSRAPPEESVCESEDFRTFKNLRKNSIEGRLLKTTRSIDRDDHTARRLYLFLNVCPSAPYVSVSYFLSVAFYLSHKMADPFF